MLTATYVPTNVSSLASLSSLLGAHEPVSIGCVCVCVCVCVVHIYTHIYIYIYI